MEKTKETSLSRENKPVPPKAQTIRDTLLRGDVIVCVIFLLILILAIFIIGRAIGLGNPTY